MKAEYRICIRPSSPGYGFNIHEVYINSDNQITFYSKNPVSPHGDTTDEMYEDFYRMWKAIESYDEPLDLDRLDKKLKIRNQMNKK